MHLDVYLLNDSKSSQVVDEGQHLRVVDSVGRDNQLSNSNHSGDMADKKARQKLDSMSIILALLPGHVRTEEFSKAS